MAQIEEKKKLLSKIYSVNINNQSSISSTPLYTPPLKPSQLVDSTNLRLENKLNTLIEKVESLEKDNKQLKANVDFSKHFSAITNSIKFSSDMITKTIIEDNDKLKKLFTSNTEYFKANFTTIDNKLTNITNSNKIVNEIKPLIKTIIDMQFYTFEKIKKYQTSIDSMNNKINVITDNIKAINGGQLINEIKNESKSNNVENLSEESVEETKFLENFKKLNKNTEKLNHFDKNIANASKARFIEP